MNRGLASFNFLLIPRARVHYCGGNVLVNYLVAEANDAYALGEGSSSAILSLRVEWHEKLKGRPFRRRKVTIGWERERREQRAASASAARPPVGE